eukprot:8220378-Alexandrium_andersonii.AAC.1
MSPGTLRADPDSDDDDADEDDDDDGFNPRLWAILCELRCPESGLQRATRHQVEAHEKANARRARIWAGAAGSPADRGAVGWIVVRRTAPRQQSARSSRELGSLAKASAKGTLSPA